MCVVCIDSVFRESTPVLVLYQIRYVPVMCVHSLTIVYRYCVLCDGCEWVGGCDGPECVGDNIRQQQSIPYLFYIYSIMGDSI